jgi:fluoroquinolone resistance protein
MMDFSTSQQVEFNDQSFKNVKNQRVEIYKRTFYDCTFIGCNFLESTFLDCRFVDATFKNCDLSLISVKGSSFTKVIFENTTLSGINWTEANWTAPLQAISFSECNISHSTFVGLQMKKLLMSKCVAKNVDFAEANLMDANLTYTDFSESRFLHTNLSGANFSYASNYAINANLNTLKKTKFMLPQAMSLLRGLDIILLDEQSS